MASGQKKKYIRGGGRNLTSGELRNDCCNDDGNFQLSISRPSRPIFGPKMESKFAWEKGRRDSDLLNACQVVCKRLNAMNAV